MASVRAVGCNKVVRVAFVCGRDESFHHANGDALNRYTRRGLAFENIMPRAAGPLRLGAHLSLLSVEVTARSTLVHGPSACFSSALFEFLMFNSDTQMCPLPLPRSQAAPTHAIKYNVKPAAV